MKKLTFVLALVALYCAGAFAQETKPDLQLQQGPYGEIRVKPATEGWNDLHITITPEAAQYMGLAAEAIRNPGKVAPFGEGGLLHFKGMNDLFYKRTAKHHDGGIVFDGRKVYVIGEYYDNEEISFAGFLPFALISTFLVAIAIRFRHRWASALGAVVLLVVTFDRFLEVSILPGVLICLATIDAFCIFIVFDAIDHGLPKAAEVQKVVYLLFYVFMLAFFVSVYVS